MFPYKNEFQVGEGVKVPADKIVAGLSPFLTPERQKKIAQVVEARCHSIAVVLENIYDRGNVSAVMRTAEAMGFYNIHVVELGERFKAANRVTQGADKWLDVQRWTATQDCVRNLKDSGYQICVTSLEASLPIGEVDFSKPTAYVLGNEKDGVSREILEAADVRVIIPMQGFVQSYNISVAGAVGLYHIFQDRQRRLGKSADLTDEQKQILRAEYYWRAVDQPEMKLSRTL